MTLTFLKKIFKKVKIVVQKDYALPNKALQVKIDIYSNNNKMK
jgi:hypothetical protein